MLDETDAILGLTLGNAAHALQRGDVSGAAEQIDYARKLHIDLHGKRSSEDQDSVEKVKQEFRDEAHRIAVDPMDNYQGEIVIHLMAEEIVRLQDHKTAC